MDINQIIKEEGEHVLYEIATGADSRIQTYEYYLESEGRFIIEVVEPQKNLNTKFEVTFSSEGNREEKGYSIAFKQQGGDYQQKTGFGVQFRILATITKIVKEQVSIYDPNVLSFQPVKETGEKGNRRLSLYMQYVKGGAGEDFDAFIIGDKSKVTVEKRNPSFPIENGYQDPETIQDIITQLSVYGGHYASDLPPSDPDYEKFSMTSWGMMLKESNGGRTGTISARRFVDWMFSVPDLSYVQGQHEPEPYEVPVDSPTQTPTGDAPIRRVSGGHTTTAMVGTFQHFLQTEVYGIPDYEVLEPFFETIKSISDFDDLRNRASNGLRAARTTTDQERLQQIIRTIDTIKQNYNDYSRRHGSSGINENQILQEVERQLFDLLGK